MPPVRVHKDRRVKQELLAKEDLLDLPGRWGRLGQKAIRDLKVRPDRPVQRAVQGCAS